MRSDYVEQILKRCEEQKQRIGELEGENRALREKYNELERTLEERIAAAVSQAVAEATAQLYVQITARDNEIVRLKAIIGKDSSNSSKPPSSNGLSNQVSTNRERSGRKTGGQAGHKGRTLKVPKNLSELAEQGKIKLKVEDHTNGASEYVSPIR